MVVALISLGSIVDGHAAPNARPVVAVFALQRQDAKAGRVQPRGSIETLAGYIGARLVASGRYLVVPAAQLKRVLAAQKAASYQDCYAESCQIEVGKELAASKTLAGSVTRVGSRCIVTVRLYDLLSATQEKAGIAKGGCKEDRILDSLDDALARLLDEPARSDDPFRQQAEDAVRRAEDAERRAKIEREREALVRGARTRRREAAWQTVSKLATTSTVARPARLAAIDRFLREYPRFNPNRETAEFYRSALRAGLEPSAAVRWRRIRRADVSLGESEVTVAQYRACVDAGACSPASVATRRDCNWGRKERSDHPINCVTWFGADTFCRWAGGRLPTENEWHTEAVDAQRPYPWGYEKANCERVVMREDGAGCGRRRTWPVCSKPEGDSVSGLCDLSGNVWEWTSTDRNGDRVIRGGGWKSARSENLESAARHWRPPSTKLSTIGFRCARSIIQ